MTTKATNNKFRFVPFVISLAITLIIGFTASLITRPEITGWYAGLEKPWFNPPPWIFAPVWTTLYVLIAIAAYLVWKHRENTVNYRITRNIYILQLLLNFSWSIVFFGMHQELGALIVIICLWISILANCIWFCRYSHTAAWLLIPYLLWVSFAGFLNLNIYLLNR
jgi:benzodiazapine receptor